jgi:TonB-linked SusC/RagA family outer membrane protein
MKRLLTIMVIFFGMLGSAWAQRIVTGMVSGDDGLPLIGANVTVKGTNLGTVTDVDGKYSLEVPPGSNVLEMSYTGFNTAEVTLGVSNVVDMVLSAGVLLEETVVTAFGLTEQKSRVGTASSTVNGDAMLRSGEVSVINSLAGKSAGINIVQSSGDPGASSRIQIRGATSITGDLQPLIVIDGIPIFNDNSFGEAFGGNLVGSGGSLGSGGGVTQQSRLNDLNPDDIANVEVIRGASAAAIWGSRGANGIIMITTKKGRSSKVKDFSVSINSSIAFDQINKEVPLNQRYGQGNNGLYQFNPTGGRSWGDFIPDRKGGADVVNDAPGNAYFQGDNGKKYYAIANGSAANPHGGKNSKDLYDVYDNLFQNGITWNNSVGINSQDKNGSIYLSLSNVDQKGIVVTNSGYRKTTGTLAITRNLGTKFAIEGSGTYSNVTSDRIQMGSNLNGLFLGGLRTPADFDYSGYSGTYVDAAGNRFAGRQRAYRNPLGANTGSIYDNPLWMVNNIQSKTSVNRFISRLQGTYYATNWLSFTARGGTDNYTDKRNDYFPVVSSGENNGGRLSREVITRGQLQLDVFARANARVNKNFGMNFLLGSGVNRRTQESSGATTRSFINTTSPQQNLNNGTAFQPFSLQDEERTISYYGTASLDLYNQLTVNLTGRTDYFSTLPKDNNNYFYPGIDGAWNLNQYLKNDYLTSAKLRAGWGQVGRGAPTYSVFNVFYAPQGTNTGFGEGWGPGINPNSYGGAFAQNTVAGNPNLRPEIKTESEFGFDLGFWKNRAKFSFTHYRNTIDDVILSVPVPESSGFTQQIANAGVLKNRGTELELSVSPVSNKNFVWNIYGNWSQNRNEVASMEGVTAVQLSGFETGASRAVVGQQLGVLWGGKWERDGQGSLVLDNGFPIFAESPGVIGDPNPAYRAGIGSDLTWKGITLNALFDASVGGRMWNGTRGALTFFGTSAETDTRTTLSASQAANLNTIDPDGNIAKVKDVYAAGADGNYTLRGEIKNYGGGDVFLNEYWYRIGPGSGFTGPEEQFVEDASWYRLRELSLSYTVLPKKWGIKGISSARITLTGRNLFLWTNYTGIDPDSSLNGPGNNGFGLDYFQNPATKTYRLGINLTF